MWISIATFVDRIAILDKRAEFIGLPAIGDMYKFIDSLGWFNKFILRRQIKRYYSGEERDGYLDAFTMHEQLKELIYGDDDGPTE